MTKDREEEQLTGCLLQAGVQYPQDKVLFCGLCPNKSNQKGNLGVDCVKVPGRKP